MTPHPYNQKLVIHNDAGITMQSLIIFISALFACLGLLIYLLYSGEKAAYDITIKHDLLSFANVQKLYMVSNDRYLGTVDDVISNAPHTPSTITLNDFMPSKGIIITIVSASPFIAQARHQDSPSLFEYDFSTDAITDKTGVH